MYVLLSHIRVHAPKHAYILISLIISNFTFHFTQKRAKNSLKLSLRVKLHTAYFPFQLSRVSLPRFLTPSLLLFLSRHLSVFISLSFGCPRRTYRGHSLRGQTKSMSILIASTAGPKIHVCVYVIFDY